MGLRIDGFDISHYQGAVPINWTAAKKAGVKFIYHKATEGTTEVDEFYAKRRAEAKANGVRFGAYHFATPTKGSAVAEAQHFLAVAKPLPGDMLPALDLETNPTGMSTVEMTAWVHEFLSTVRAALHLKKMVLYTQYSLGGKFAAFLWAPRYSNSNALPRVPFPFLTWSIWQFSNGVYGSPNRVPGVPAPVDINHLHLSTRLRFSQLLIPAVK